MIFLTPDELLNLMIGIAPEEQKAILENQRERVHELYESEVQLDELWNSVHRTLGALEQCQQDLKGALSRLNSVQQSFEYLVESHRKKIQERKGRH